MAIASISAGQHDRQIVERQAANMVVHGRLCEEGVREARKAHGFGSTAIFLIGMVALVSLTGSFTAALFTGLSLFCVYAVLVSVCSSTCWLPRVGYNQRHYGTRIVPVETRPSFSTVLFGPSAPAPTVYVPGAASRPGYVPPITGEFATVGSRRIVHPTGAPLAGVPAHPGTGPFATVGSRRIT